MGYELRRQMREALGPDIAGLQRAIALEIADDANDETRRSFVTLETLARWTAAKDTAVVRTSLKRLATAGWEFRVPIGQGKDGRLLYAVPGRRMEFRVPPFEGATTVPPSEPKEEPRFPIGVTTVPTEGTTVPTEGTGVTPFPSPTSVTSSISSPQPSAPPATPGTDTAAAFDAFWQAYPRRVAKADARKAYASALKAGADPQHITDAAGRHAAHWSAEGRAPTYVPYPATWLRRESYNDELHTPQPAKPQQPTTYQDYSERGIF